MILIVSLKCLLPMWVPNDDDFDVIFTKPMVNGVEELEFLILPVSAALALTRGQVF
jgi:hypothetical protein